MTRHRTVAVLLLWLAAAPAAAQETTGTITGRVTDPSGAVLPGVTVTVRNVETGSVRVFITSATGVYIAALLPIGRYQVTFELQGFQPYVARDIVLHVNDRLEVNARLGVGGVAETVTVSVDESFVQPIPSVQTLIGPQQVQQLPLNNRNFVQLATLVPGVTSDLEDEVGVGLASRVSISVAGARRNAVNWLVDGALNVDVGSNITLLSTPTLESIQEFKIITSSYMPEWPRSGGGIVNVVTKGGSQQFSGTAYEFFRNDKLNANSFFRNLSSNPTINSEPPRLRYHNFGFTIGGPALPSREKLFFFFSEEFRRISRTPAALTATVPDPRWLTDPTNPNYVPPGQRDPNAVALLQAFPTPNVSGTNRFIESVPNRSNTRQEVVRVDYDLNPNWRLTGRYTHDLSETTEAGGLFFGTALPNVATTETKVPGHVAVAALRSVLGGASLNEFSYQFSGNKISTQNPEGTRNTRSDFGVNIPEVFPENAAGRVPTIVISGLSGAIIGATQAFNIEYWNHTFTDNFTMQRGNHSFKFGGLITFEQKNENATNETQGRFSFGSGGGRTPFQNFLIGNRDGLCGAACSYTEPERDITNHLRFNRYEMYAQDSWRIRPNLTLDYGVRYALYPGVEDRDNVLATFSPAHFDPSRAPTFANPAGTLIVRGTGDPLNGSLVAGLNSPFGEAIHETDKNNVQPRVGFAWDPLSDGNTIVRGAYGLYYDQPLVGIFELNAFFSPAFVNTVTLLNASLSNPAAGVTQTTTGLPFLFATSVPFETPRTQQWNVGVQRELYPRGAIEVSYVGSRGDNLIRPVDINQPQPQDVITLGSVNRARPFPGFSFIRFHETTAISRYHGLLTYFKHDFAGAGQVSVSYTLSRNKTDATNDRDVIDLPQNPLDKRAEFALARTDRTHVFVANYVYEVPFFRESANAILRGALGGWQIAGITELSSGQPAPLVQVDTLGQRRGNRANQVGDPRAGEQSGLFWFDPAAFTPPPLGEYGTSSRAPFRLPGRNQTDLSLSKNFYPTDRTRLQFRADLINAFNHTQFLAVDWTCTSAANTCEAPGDTFGQFTSTRNPREIQLSLKFYW